ncbi:MAG: RNA methyltransferase [Candidatus Marinimicrobia bacterium]|nr:RNA methyltransferase [Candidatus Neomarinimicrobiota bacterium]
MNQRNQKRIGKPIFSTVAQLIKSERQFLRSLRQKKYRYLHKKFLIEGLKPVLEAIDSGFPVEKIYLSNEFANKLSDFDFETLKSQNKNLQCVDTADIHYISALSTPEGIVALGKMISERVPLDDLSLYPVVYLYEINDPGNLGAILRTARWFGIKSVMLSPNSVDLFSPKVVRSSMGAHFAVSCYQNVLFDDLNKYSARHGIPILAADMSGAAPDKAQTNRWILVLGSEAHGLPEDIINNATSVIGIPRHGSGESLNLSVSAGILFYKLTDSRKV